MPEPARHTVHQVSATAATVARGPDIRVAVTEEDCRASQTAEWHAMLRALRRAVAALPVETLEVDLEMAGKCLWIRYKDDPGWMYTYELPRSLTQDWIQRDRVVPVCCRPETQEFVLPAQPSRRDRVDPATGEWILDADGQWIGEYLLMDEARAPLGPVRLAEAETAADSSAAAAATD